MRRDRITLPNGIELSFSPELVAELEARLREWRREEGGPRELADEIASYLETHTTASAIQLARALRARDQNVRKALENDPRFQRVPPPAAASARLKSWALASTASAPVPGAGTSPSSADGDTR
jgi:hypothetical protein